VPASKRTARNAREGEEQLRQYVAEISAKQKMPPFGFMTNGLHHFFWEVGLAHPRAIAGFFSSEDLQRLRFIRQNKTPLKDAPINKKIVERSYQHEAIRRVAEAFESGKRRALLVMATGTVGFDHGQYAAVRMVKTEIGESIPRSRVVPLNWDLKLDLRPIAQVPSHLL
jgi:type I restriction enzyme R subunit